MKNKFIIFIILENINDFYIFQFGNLNFLIGSGVVMRLN
jgi:hypothetical protein